VRLSVAHRLKVLAPLLAGYCAVAIAATSSPPTVVDLLRSLSATGVDVLFSSALVAPDLIAPLSSKESDLKTRVEEALAANGLQLKKTSDRHYVVTRAPNSQHPQSPAPVANSVDRVANLSALDEIVVFASHYTYLNESTGEPQSLDRRDIEQIAGAQNDAIRAVRASPGVASTYSARPYIRGGTADDTLIRFDGITLINPFHFRQFQSVLSPFLPADVERIDVYSGGFPVRYGTRTSGVIDVTPRAMESGYDLRADASLLSVDLVGAGRAEQWPVEWLASVRQSTSESNVLQPIDANPGDPTFFDALTRVRWQVASTASATAGWLLLDDTARARAGARDQIATAHSRDEYAWLAWDWTPLDTLQSHSSIAFTKSKNNHFGSLDLTGVADGTLIEDHDFKSLAVRSEWAYAPREGLLWDMGFEANSENAMLYYRQRETYSSFLIPSFVSQTTVDMDSTQAPHSTTVGAFTSARRHWQSFEAELGLRIDTQAYRGFGERTQLTPRLNIRYDAAPDWHVYASWGKFSEAQRIDEYRSEENQTSPDPASRATHTVVGVSHERDAAIHWRAELYHDHWSTVSPYFVNALGLVTLLPELQPDRIKIAPLASQSDGLELSAKRPIGFHLNMWATYTVSKAFDELPSGNIPRSWDQRQALNLGTSWQTPSNTASILVGWHSGWPRTGLRAIAATSTSPTMLLLGTGNQQNWGNYLSVDLHLAHSLSTPVGELSLWIDALDATNRNNDCCSELSPLIAPSKLPGWSTDSWSGRSTNVGFTWRLQRPH